MVKGFNEAWRNSGRKESEISIRYQYKVLYSIQNRSVCAENAYNGVYILGRNANINKAIMGN